MAVNCNIRPMLPMNHWLSKAARRDWKKFVVPATLIATCELMDGDVDMCSIYFYISRCKSRQCEKPSSLLITIMNEDPSSGERIPMIPIHFSIEKLLSPRKD